MAVLFCLQLFAGFFIPITSIPVWLRWAQYLCSLKYSLNLLVVVEFENLPVDHVVEGREVVGRAGIGAERGLRPVDPTSIGRDPAERLPDLELDPKGEVLPAELLLLAVELEE